MTATLTELTAAALKLSAEDRAELVDTLLDSLPDDCPEGVLSTDDPGYDAEIKRRVDEVRSGDVVGIPWEEVRRRMAADAEGDDVG